MIYYKNIAYFMEEWKKADKETRIKMYENQQNKMKHRYFAADFECTVSLEKVRVYLVTIKDIENGDEFVLYSIEEFLQFCKRFYRASFYFHNGSNYDFEFIINAVFKDDSWINKLNKSYRIKRKDNTELTLTKTGKLAERKQHYYNPTQYIYFYDSLDIIKGSINQIGKLVGLEKGNGEIETPLIVDIFEDGTYTYKEDLFYGSKIIKSDTKLKDDLINKRWIEYALIDVRILAKAIKKFNVLDENKKGNHTIASIAWSELLKFGPRYSEYLHQLNIENKKSEKKNDDATPKEIRKKYNMWSKDAYKGGIAWSNPLYIGKLYETKNGLHFDYTSMYPSIYMNSDKYPLPMATPTREKTNLYIIKIKRLKAKVKDGCFPLLKARTDANKKRVNKINISSYNNYYDGDITLTKVEWEYVKKNYDIISYDNFEVRYFHRHYLLEEALRNFGNHYYKIKESSNDSVEVMHSKLMINSCYGYLGFFNKSIKVYDWSIKDGITSKSIRDESITGLSFAEVPAGAFITGYARVMLANLINKIGIEKVTHCDTDSVFVVDTTLDDIRNKGIDFTINEDKRLGVLNLEHEFNKVITLKPKTYVIGNDEYWLKDIRKDKIIETTKDKSIYDKWEDTRFIKKGDITTQALAGSNYKFNKMESFKLGQRFLSKQTYRVDGGVVIDWKEKILGSMDVLE